MERGDIVVTCESPLHVYVLTGEKTSGYYVGIKLSAGAKRYKIKASEVLYTMGQADMDCPLFSEKNKENPGFMSVAEFEAGQEAANTMSRFITIGEQEKEKWRTISMLDQGDLILINGKEMKFNGVMPARPKYPISVKAEDGKFYKATIMAVSFIEVTV